MTYPLLPTIGIIASVLNILTIATGIHQIGNIGMHLISVWLFLFNLPGGIEAIVWHGASGIKAPVWCDICALRMAYVYNVLLSMKLYQQRAVLAWRL